MSSFVHLHVHTQYSLLDGANRIGPLLDQAQALGMPAVAMTDHGALFGAIKFYQAALARGVKPIIGVEAYVAPGSRFDRQESGTREARGSDGGYHREGIHGAYHHLVLLATNLMGYRNLLKLVSAAHLEGFYYRPRIDKALLEEHHEGLVALSGCLRGEVPSFLLQGREDEARRTAEFYRDLLGPGRFFLEVQANGLALQHDANRSLVALSRQTGIPLVATNDSHYLHRDDARAHDVLLCLQTGKGLSDPDRMRFGTDELYFKSGVEMAAAFPDHPEAMHATLAIAEQCELTIPLGHLMLPPYPAPAGSTEGQYLETLSREGLEMRLRESRVAERAAYEDRFRNELAVITGLGYEGYFLIVWDIVRFAKSRKIPVGPGRGSSAGSLIAYCLGITDIDPLAYGLLFERFLTPERASPPDIDLDFCVERRGEVLNYVTERYGAGHVAQIITFGTLKPRAAIRDVGRVLEVPYAEMDRVAKLIPMRPKITLEEALAEEPQLQELCRDQRMRDVFTYAKALEGLPRHASTHAAGVVVSSDPLVEHVPLYRGEHGDILTQYDDDDAEKIGLVKFDILGLRTLTVLHGAERLIRMHHPDFDLARLPLNDARTYALLASGHTTGVFQLESTGMRDLLTRLRPERFEDLIAVLALHRPGPIESDMGEDFIRRKQGRASKTHEVPQLAPLLGETYGAIIYQEQVMRIAIELAGFTPSQADSLRKAMGKKNPEEMEKSRTLFVDGARATGLTTAKATRLFDRLAQFAGYAFNKSHSAAYAIISYKTAYLKTYFPREFMAALLTSEMGNTDKIADYINECRETGILVLPPDVNESESGFTVVEGGIRFGLAAVKHVGEAAIEVVLLCRRQGGRFTSLFDCCRRVDLRKVNRRVLESLIKCGAFDSTGARRSQLMEVLGSAIEAGGRSQVMREEAQTALFAAAETPSSESPLPDIPEWDEADRLRFEKAMAGFYITSHPLKRYEARLSHLKVLDSLALQTAQDGVSVRLAGIPTSSRVVNTRKGSKMAYVRLEDLRGTFEVILFPDLYSKAMGMLMEEVPLLVSGTVDRPAVLGEDEGGMTGQRGIRVKALTLEPLTLETSASPGSSPSGVERIPAREDSPPRLCEIMVACDGGTAQDLAHLSTLLRQYPGPCPVMLRLILPGLDTRTIAADLTVEPSPALVAHIEAFLGERTVKLR